MLPYSRCSTRCARRVLRIPKLRTGSFFPSLLERRRRVDQALFAVVMKAYLQGVSTRKVDDLVNAAEGRSNRAIAPIIFVSDKTVEAHVRSIFTKLGLPTAPNDHRRVLAVVTYLSQDHEH
jgi:transposase-like protein